MPILRPLARPRRRSKSPQSAARFSQPALGLNDRSVGSTDEIVALEYFESPKRDNCSKLGSTPITRIESLRQKSRDTPISFSLTLILLMYAVMNAAHAAKLAIQIPLGDWREMWRSNHGSRASTPIPFSPTEAAPTRNVLKDKDLGFNLGKTWPLPHPSKISTEPKQTASVPTTATRTGASKKSDNQEIRRDWPAKSPVDHIVRLFNRKGRGGKPGAE